MKMKKSKTEIEFDSFFSKWIDVFNSNFWDEMDLNFKHQNFSSGVYALDLFDIVYKLEKEQKGK